jgi:S-DNA-T family DNA segregation ATPase FtsK/SpoIIIE
VITGLIKANFPTRISFRLMSGTDSRTVLDTIGAENLLGMGDMLYRPPGTSSLQRVHGAFVDEAEIEQVVDFVAAQRKPEFDESILAAPEVDAEDSDEPVDELYDQAVSVVIEAGFASISMVQRKLRIGYNRSARIVEEMERQGLVGPTSGGSSRREVLVGGAHLSVAG